MELYYFYVIKQVKVKVKPKQFYFNYEFIVEYR